VASTRFLLVVGASAVAGLLALACGADDGAKKNTAAAPNGAPGSQPGPGGTPAPGPGGTPAPAVGPDGQPLPPPAAGPGGTPVPSPSGPISPQAFYEGTVKPTIVKECGSCHVQGGTGPTTILDYASAKALLVQGATAIDSLILRNMTNRIPHTGGNRCTAKGVTGSPCKEVMDWFKAEAGANGTADGRIEQSFSTGEVRGWAANYKDPAAVVKVLIYKGTAEAGTLLATVDANLPGFDGGYNGDHVFFADLPDSVNDTQVHNIYAYAEIAGKKHLLGEPFEHLGFTSKPAGKAHFDSVLKPALTSSCGGCHDFTYESAYRRLVNPTPTSGGTATDNKLINKPAGTVSHGGGTRCANKTAVPCSHIQTWWGLEFN